MQEVEGAQSFIVVKPPFDMKGGRGREEGEKNFDFLVR